MNLCSCCTSMGSARITEGYISKPMVVGSTVAKRKDENKVIIGIDFGEFVSKNRLSPLNTSFMAYFLQKVRSLGYIVVGVNEYYTSKRCSECKGFVGQVNIRRLYCPKRKAFIHRDIMAGHSIANVVRGHLVDQQQV